MSDKKDRVTLAILSSAAKDGASDEGILALLAKLEGEQMVAFPEYPHGRPVQIKVDRVRAVSEHHEYGNGSRTLRDGAVLHFNGLSLGHPKERLVVDWPLHKVIRDLREAGWKY